MTYLKTLPDESIHLTVTSPPYYNARDYSVWKTYDDYLNFLDKTFRLVMDATCPGRMCIVNLSPVIVARESRAHESSRYPIPFHFFSIMDKMGWKYIDDIVWAKPDGAAANRNGGFYQHRKPVAYKPNLVTETIFVFQKPADFLIDKVVRSYSGDILKQSLVSDGYERTNLWRINPETSSSHLAPYPLELSDKLVTYYSFVGDNVLDPFMGSGTTAVSSALHNRNYMGCDIQEEYVKLARQRVSTAGALNEFLVDT